MIIKDNYTLLFQELIDLIDWNILKIFAYRLDINYLTIENHLKSLIHFHIAELDSLRDISDFMKSPSELKQIIKGVSLGSLSNYNNKINYEVLLPIMNDIILKALISIPVISFARIQSDNAVILPIISPNLAAIIFCGALLKICRSPIMAAG